MSNGTEVEDLMTFSQMNVVSIISLLTSGLSLVGSGSILFCVVYHRRVCSPEIFPIFHLSVADGMASLFMMIVSVLFLNTYPSYPGSPGPCGYLIAIMTSLYICTFFLTLGYALEAFIRLRRRLQAYLSLEGSRTNGVSNYCMYVVYFMSWLVPLSLGIFLMLVTHFTKVENNSFTRVLPMECSLCFPVFSAHQTYCWSQVEDGTQWLLMYRLIFLIPLLFVFSLNMVLYICISRDFRQVSMRRGLLSYHQRQEEAMLRKKAFMYQTAFIVCWIPTMVLEVASFFSSYNMLNFYALFVLQALVGPLQGLLNCIIYGWKRESFRRALSESSHLLSTNRGGAGMSFTL
ncbi:transmembrane protein 116-like [Littorina saxatilis]|uniref:G-protein coupled receptors family 1 profile domain-containing protein n=1 Tax=Littorina saxatilis TaxID=31220 RepID=A0AAN9BBV1_9CAEN